MAATLHWPQQAKLNQKRAKAYGPRLRKARLARDWTQWQLSQELGVSAMSVLRYESGQRYPKRDVLAKIAAVLGVVPVAE